ncbi:PREDICTED: WW domain binding protein 1-like [Branchiostoma belcheri]|uniref:WW domain binding protein 1-like n=1 Tax=Branchiostoma belcheri TaxID=7741 RepID=A0A6P4ZUD3_BRABE|nr:PREDICTED: WW domain binding protein 1-like [Branchiostoma belcheri]
MAVCGLLIASLFAGATLVAADDVCISPDGRLKTCYGDFAYCCGANNFSCCNEGYYVYSAWWFWMIWVMLFIFFTACGYAIRRRRLAARTVIIQGTPVPPPQAYVTTGTTVYGATYGTQPPQYSAAVPPPPYQADSAKQPLLH